MILSSWLACEVPNVCCLVRWFGFQNLCICFKHNIHDDAGMNVSIEMEHNHLKKKNKRNKMSGIKWMILKLHREVIQFKLCVGKMKGPPILRKFCGFHASPLTTINCCRLLICENRLCVCVRLSCVCFWNQTKWLMIICCYHSRNENRIDRPSILRLDPIYL